MDIYRAVCRPVCARRELPPRLMSGARWRGRKLDQLTSLLADPVVTRATVRMCSRGFRGKQRIGGTRTCEKSFSTRLSSPYIYICITMFHIRATFSPLHSISLPGMEEELHARETDGFESEFDGIERLGRCRLLIGKGMEGVKRVL